MRKLGFLISGLLLSLALACGGGSTTSPTAPPERPATGLAYTNPTGAGWRLVKDPSSTPTRLVLNLVGPTGLLTRGVGFNLQAPATVRFGKFVTTDRVTTDLPIQDTGVYSLLNHDPRDLGNVPIPNDPLEPRLLAGGVKKGNLLTVGIFQKDRYQSAKESGRALCQIALEFDPAANLNAGDKLALAITKSGYLPEDIGELTVHPTPEKAQKGRLVAMPIALGVLSAN
jgi:hypothetical protein